MFCKHIEYKDFLGNDRKEDFYFHLTKADLIKWVTTSGDYTLDQYVKRLYEERNGKKIMETFEELIRMSYGQISLDGRQFNRSEEIVSAFMATEAYSIIFSELVTDASKAAEFFNGILPKELVDEVSKELKKNPEGIPAELRDYAPIKDTVASLI